jgi:D-sedoheptulose 7-phosphate isomerase
MCAIPALSNNMKESQSATAAVAIFRRIQSGGVQPVTCSLKHELDAQSLPHIIADCPGTIWRFSRKSGTRCCPPGCAGNLESCQILTQSRNMRLGESMGNYTSRYLSEVATIASQIDQTQIEKMIDILLETRVAGGRLFFIGVGGGAGNATHAVNDFRKIANIESYTPSDNVSELTARVNDDGWDSSFAGWLSGSRLRRGDTLFVFSVGGGNREKNISTNIVRALELAQEVGAKIIGVVGRDGGYTAKVADAAVIIPTASVDTVTPHSESFQAVVWHLIVSHPRLKENEMKWESVL